MYDLIIRRALEEDQKKLKDILLENNQKSTILINGQSIYFYAEIDKEKIGLIGAEISDEAALIRSLAVLKQWRGNGFANKLINILLTELRKRQIKHLYLFSRNTGRFWKKIGFSECAVQEIINNLPNAPQVVGYLNDNSIWTDVAWHKLL